MVSAALAMAEYIPLVTVQQLLSELNGVEDWHTLGVLLGVPVPKLREIQRSYSQDGVQRWKTEMFQYWLDSTPTASWEDVIRALERPELSHHALAARLRSKYKRVSLTPGNEPNIASGSDARPSTGGATATEMQADVEVVKRLQYLESKSSHMLTRVRGHLLSCDLGDIRFYLDDLLGTDEFSKCDTVDRVLHQLCSKYIDTFNIFRLEQLASHLQNSEVIDLIEEYEDIMNKFLTETVITDFQQAVKDRVGPVQPEEMAKITIKIPTSLASQRTLKDMKELAGKAFGDYYRSLVKLKVIEGSILITWFFPETLTKELVRLAQTSKAVFSQEEVEEVTVAEMTVFSHFEETGTARAIEFQHVTMPTRRLQGRTIVGGGTGAAVGIGIGVGAGFGIGALVGSIIPGAGTAIGALVGAGVGAGVGAFTGGGVLGGAGAAVGAGVASAAEQKKKTRETDRKKRKLSSAGSM